jgi:hypothetical protein
MTIRILHNPRCSKSRATLALLQEQGVEPEITLYLDNPPGGYCHICASSREQITSAASRGATVRNPEVLRDEVDTLFAGEAPATKAEKARWAREKKASSAH